MSVLDQYMTNPAKGVEYVRQKGAEVNSADEEADEQTVLRFCAMREAIVLGDAPGVPWHGD
jgi:hypothetical protein